MNICLNCGIYTAHIRRNRCEACYLYWHRHQQERPEKLISAYAQKQIEHRARSQVLRSSACCDAIVVVTPDYIDWALCEKPPGHLGWHRGWAGEWIWDKHANLTLERSPELQGSDTRSTEKPGECV